MALFSRRKKTEDAGPEPTVEPAEPEASGEPGEPEGSDERTAEPAASVGISVSSFQGLGVPTAAASVAAAAPAAGATDAASGDPAGAAGAAGADARDAGAATTAEPAPSAAGPSTAARAPRPAEAPAPAETIPGLRDNVLLRDALAALPAEPASADLLEVARQLLQGHLFLRVKGDARALLAAGEDLPLGIAKVGDAQWVLAYSSGAALRRSLEADRDTDTSAMGQPVLAVLRHTLAGPYAGLIIDNASAPARAVLPRDLIDKLVGQADPTLELKTLLSGPRDADTATRVGTALTRVKFWVAVNTSAQGRMGVAEARGTDGARLIELYSHPLEVATLRRGDQAAPMTAAQLAAALRADAGIDGAIVDAHGPWIRLSRDDLGPVIALAGS